MKISLSYSDRIKERFDFFSRAMEAVGVSKKTQKNAMNLLKTLAAYDPYQLTKFEFSFKIKEEKISKEVRFLNMDADGYSCRNPIFFLKRVELFSDILKDKISPTMLSKTSQALAKIAQTPMDLYLGFDVKDNNYLFACWLIFGGVKRSGQVDFWGYDFNKIINTILNTTGLKRPLLLKDKILNMGVDIEENYLRYKFYYLCQGRNLPSYPFIELMKGINRSVPDFKYFYFFSEMYNEKGKLLKEKLFLEFLEDIRNSETSKIRKILKELSRARGFSFDFQKLEDILTKCGGRISLIGFEANGFLTFYLRPD